MKKKLINYLSDFVTPERLQLFDNVLNQRTAYITVILEDIYQSQNASAVLRTCDCFGIQNVHIIENKNTFNVDKEVDMGASKWLNLHKYNQAKNNSADAIKKLKEKGYRIIATSPHISNSMLPDFDLNKGKAALVFGSEMPGISETIMKQADEFLKIPMYGFTESFNISVSAAIILYQLSEKLKRESGIDWKLSNSEKESIKLNWLRSSIKRSDLLVERFTAENGEIPDIPGD